MNTTYDVSIWQITTYYVRWKVGKGELRGSFNTRTLADSFRSELVTAARNGEPFELTSGLPVSKDPEDGGCSQIRHELVSVRRRVCGDQMAGCVAEAPSGHRRGADERDNGIVSFAA